MKKYFLLPVALVLGFVAFQNCAKGPSSAVPVSAQEAAMSLSAKYFKKSQKITVKVLYEPGAEPFVGSTGSGMPYWRVLEDNLKSIFQYRSAMPTISVPQTLGEMIAIPTQGKSSWTSADLVALSSTYGQFTSTDSEFYFFVYFLKGYFDSGSGASSSVIGVSLSGTNILGMFKDVVKSTGANPSGPVPKYVEQSTLVHEMGHALGFVNNGVPMTSAYQDTAHGAHSLNASCVMYWQNEGLADLVPFVQRIIASGSTVLWGPEILADAKALSE